MDGRAESGDVIGCGFWSFGFGVDFLELCGCFQHDHISYHVSRDNAMFGAFRPTNSLGGGLLWYVPIRFMPQFILLRSLPYADGG